MLAWLKSLFARLRPYAAHIDPPVFGPYPTQAAAAQAASDYARLCGGSGEKTTGTPSMVPLIPARPTYLALRPIPFAEARLGIVASYRSPLVPLSSMTHRLVSGSVASGFIPSGDNNRWSESNIRVTAENFLGEIVGIFPSTETAKAGES